ncbi:CWF19-like protein 2 homolog [Lepeophtheirus salmonis]|uniref:CWF19-like protein 2 homolog n=1 Tax=Lepeophtheirus salmonis TaxID=72036 RepID=UPI001AE72CEB|nr:CWF19-like protein 2 [Lepeophtheirus salmonis]
MFSTFKGRRDREEEKKKSEENARKAASLELNPHLRKDGNSRTNESVRSNAGPVSWLKKAFKRAEERAEAEGRSIEEIAEERWGSLDAYYELLREAEGHGGRSRSPQRHSRSCRSPSPRKSRNFSKPREDEEYRKKKHSSWGRRSHPNSSWKTEERRKYDKNELTDSVSEASIKPKKEEASSIKKESVIVKDEMDENKILSEKELNALGAKIIKAEILGNTELANKLKKKLEKAKLVSETASNRKESEEVVILTRIDSQGNERPLPSDVVDASNSSRSSSKKLKPLTHNKDGHRDHYFPDDSRHDLKTLFMQEKSGSSESQAETFTRLSGKRIKERMNEDFDVDDLFVSKASKASIEKDSAREKERAIVEHKLMTKTLENCQYCHKSSSFSKHLVIATGKSCSLILPDNIPLTEGHCLIVPLSHVSCSTIVDEDIFEEIQYFRKALFQMFKQEYNADVVFFETVMGLKKHPHMKIEAVPIPNEGNSELDVASPSIYFQKAIQECETEWSMNKKLIKLGEKGLRRSIPKGLPYFHVDFGLDNGFAHVIEDEDYFPKKFAHEIIGGMLDLDHRRWKGRKSEDFEEQRNRVLSFGGKWQNYDFTKQIV